MPHERFRPPDHEHDHFIPATVVGSYPQADWLTDIRENGDDADEVAEANDDAVRAALKEHERAGLDVVTDGEQRREGMVEYFTHFVDGYENDGGGGGWNRDMPSVTQKVETVEPWLVDDYEFAADYADRPLKTTVTGPFTLASFSSPEAYDSVQELAHDFADLVAVEVERLGEAGAPWVQLDEPALGMSPHGDLAIECLERVADRTPEDVRLGVHVCSGNYGNLAPELYEFPVDEVDLEFSSEGADTVADVFEGVDLPFDVGVGVVDTQNKAVDDVETIEGRLRDALEHVPPERLTATPDCGMKPLTRPAARGKVRNLVTAVRNVETDLDAGEIETA